MKTLIIYYSEREKTQIVSRTLSMHLKADIIKIEDLKDRKGFANRLLSSIHAIRESKTKIYPEKVDLSDYDLIYIGTPTWSSNPTPAILTLIDNCDWMGKDVIAFTTMDKSGGKSTLNRMEEKLRMRGARVIETFSIKTKDKSSEKLINDTESMINILDLKMYSGV